MRQQHTKSHQRFGTSNTPNNAVDWNDAMDEMERWQAFLRE